MAKRVLNSEIMEKLNNIENKFNLIQQKSKFDFWFSIGLTSIIGGISFSYIMDEKLTPTVFLGMGIALMIVSNIKNEILSRKIKRGK